jgi:hypothetical protein
MSRYIYISEEYYRPEGVVLLHATEGEKKWKGPTKKSEGENEEREWGLGRRHVDDRARFFLFGYGHSSSSIFVDFADPGSFIKFFFLIIVLLLNYYGKILSMLKMYHKKCVIVHVIVWFVDAKFHKVLDMKYFV